MLIVSLYYPTLNKFLSYLILSYRGELLYKHTSTDGCMQKGCKKMKPIYLLLFTWLLLFITEIKYLGNTILELIHRPTRQVRQRLIYRNGKALVYTKTASYIIQP